MRFDTQQIHQQRALLTPQVTTGSKINCQIKYVRPKNAKLPSPNFHYQTTSKNAKFDLLGITNLS